MVDSYDFQLTDPELRDMTARRDVQSVGAFEVRYTDTEPFLAALQADIDAGAVEGKIVWIGVLSRPARLEEVLGKRLGQGGERQTLWDAKLVDCSYLARGQLHKLSAWQGVALKPALMGGAPKARETTQATAQRLQETLRRLQTALSRHTDYDVRGGGSAHVHDLMGAWAAGHEDTIEAPEVLLCVHCEQEIYFANKAWRHRKTRRTEALVDGRGRDGRRIKVVDHEATPPPLEAFI